MIKKRQNFLFEDLDKVPSLKELAFSLIAFILTVIIALIADWKAADIVWGAWLASLLIGLSFFFIIVFKIMKDKAKGIHLTEEEGSGPGCLGSAVFLFIGLIAWLSGPGPVRIVLIILIVLDIISILLNILAPKKILNLNPDLPVIRVLLFIPNALFIFFFFLGHFGGFHLGHAFFLGFLVPLKLEITGTIDSLAGARTVFFSFFRELFLAYWPYVLSVALASFNTYRKALAGSSKNYMTLPYKNVIRIHLLIFILAPIAMAGLGKAVMIVVLFFFYFPVERTVAFWRARKK